MTVRYSIIYTQTDEAPALATYSLLPIIHVFAGACGVPVETRDISLSGRILASFPEWLRDVQRVPDALGELGALAGRPEANIIKLPNISASLPQLKSAIAELQTKGYAIPDYPDEVDSDAEPAARERSQEILRRYNSVKGSAVNPVLREGNSDRRAPNSVKQFARAHPHSMGAWSPNSKTHVAHMSRGDFRSNEQSVTVGSGGSFRIEWVDVEGHVRVLKDDSPLSDGEVIDATYMSVRALSDFLAREIEDAREQDLLFSLHLKATMMKVSDPIIFGHAVKAFFRSVFEKHDATFSRLGIDPNNGLGQIQRLLAELPEAERSGIESDIQAALAQGPRLAMVNSDRGITNLHVPSDVIVDASMPAMIRSSGKMWNAAGELEDTKAVIPDSSYAGIYAETIAFCKEHGAFDPATMGTVSNVGLMAQKAEEYGSHDKTFEVPRSGTIRVVDGAGQTLLEHSVEAGDIWRMCQTRDVAIKDWIGLAVERARATGVPAIFWLDENRAHDAELIRKVRHYLPGYDTSDLDIRILSPVDAMRYTLERLRNGQDTISVTGNVLRDYLTDLFPILELGTSAKMLSIVPLLNGGRLYETGAGGSAPKHVQQFHEENHLRWDSLGEFLALAVSLEHFAAVAGRPRARILGQALDRATAKLLAEGKSPSRKVGELDNRGSHFYLAMYWAEALALQTEDVDLANRFKALAEALSEKETKIVEELNQIQGQSVDTGGYYAPDPTKTSEAMRPSGTLNAVLAGFDEGSA